MEESMREILKKYLFCNIGWMNFYEGITPADPEITGGGSSDIKFERCNFAPVDGVFYGYVQPKGKDVSARILIENIENGSRDKHSPCEENVFVIWTAPHPESGTVVAGWYKNATIYREFQRFQTAPKLHGYNSIFGYRISAPVAESHLLPIDERTISIPRSRKGEKGVMGQSNVWFGKSSRGPQGPALAQQVWELANQNHQAPNRHRAANVNPEHNKDVEDAAIDFAIKHYKGRGYTVKSVESENKGWDLEAKSAEEKLLIEVKGLSGSAPVGSLSSNEYDKFEKKMPNYRLAIVTNALDNPKMWICYYCKKASDWKVIDGDYDVDVKITRVDVKIKKKG